jgi:hypothetical protein
VDKPDWDWIRATLIQRSGGRCEVSGERFTGPDGWSVHHRQPRGMGGTRNPRIHDLTNLLAVTGDGTRGVHGWIESHRDLAREHGWLVPWPLDPATIPLTLHSGRVVLLGEYDYLTAHNPDHPGMPLWRDNPLVPPLAPWQPLPSIP